MGRWGIVDGSLFRDFFSVAAVLVHPHSLRTGFRLPARVGGGAFPGAALAREPTAALRRSSDLRFFFPKHPGGCGDGFLRPSAARSAFSENSADHPGACISCFLAGFL